MATQCIKVNMTPSHPGDFIRTEILEELGLNETSAAEILGVPRVTLSDLLNGHVALSPEMALRIEKAFDMPMDILLRMQAWYDAAQMQARRRSTEVRERVSGMPEWVAAWESTVKALEVEATRQHQRADSASSEDIWAKRISDLYRDRYETRKKAQEEGYYKECLTTFDFLGFRGFSSLWGLASVLFPSSIRQKTRMSSMLYNNQEEVVRADLKTLWWMREVTPEVFQRYKEAQTRRVRKEVARELVSAAAVEAKTEVVRAWEAQAVAAAAAKEAMSVAPTIQNREKVNENRLLHWEKALTAWNAAVAWEDAAVAWEDAAKWWGNPSRFKHLLRLWKSAKNMPPVRKP